MMLRILYKYVLHRYAQNIVLVVAALLPMGFVLLALQVVEQFGNSRRWSEIAKHVPGRTGKQCRERWVNHMK